MPHGAAGPSPCRFVRSTPERRSEKRVRNGSGPAPRDRRGAGVAPGSLGPVGNGSAGHAPGTGAPGCRFRFSDRGTGSDHTSRSRHGRPAGHFCRVRRGDSAGTNAGWVGSCTAERKATGSAGDRGRPRCGNPETAPRRRQQIRNRPPAADRPDIATAHPGGSISEQGMNVLRGRCRGEDPWRRKSTRTSIH